MRALLVVAATLQWPQVLQGVLQGAGLHTELSCVQDVKGDAQQVAQAVALLEKRDAKDIEAGLVQLGKSLEQVPEAVKACNASAADVAHALYVVAKLKDPAFVKEHAVILGENLLLNGAAIGQEVIQAKKDAEADQSLAFGTDVGGILVKVFGPKPTLHKPDWPKVGLGVLAGFANFQGTSDQLCLSAAKSEEEAMNNAYQLFKEHSTKDVLEGLKLMAGALQDTPGVIADCQNATAATKAEAQKLLEALALLKHPLDFAYHVGKDLVVNGHDILAELEGASEAYEQQNWEGFGEGIGEALEKLLVGEVVLAEAAGCEWPQVLFGVLSGAGFGVEESCVLDAAHAGKDLAQAIELLAKKDKASVEQALKELQLVLQEGPKVLSECKAAEQDVESLEKLLKQLGSPESIAIEVGKNILLNGVAIYGEVQAAEADHAAGKCEPMGRDVGQILQKVFLPKATIVV